MRIDTVEIQISDLVKQTFQFYKSGDRVVLDSFGIWERATKRHAYRRTEGWFRLNARDNTISKPDVPPAVVEQVLGQFRAAIHYAEELR